MRKDPGERNEYFSTLDVFTYLMEYSEQAKRALSFVNKDALEAAAELIWRADRIFVGGNGGSAAISDHLFCDFGKGCGMDVVPLVSSTAMLTAIGNDYGYEYTLLEPFKLACPDPKKDILILISSSGNSPNIVKCAEVAKAWTLPIIGMTGFDGGTLRHLANISLHAPVNNYGVVEDCHQMLMHVLAQYLKCRKSP